MPSLNPVSRDADHTKGMSASCGYRSLHLGVRMTSSTEIPAPVRMAKALEPTSAMSPGMSQAPTITTPAMTQAGMILGTAAYMSPEQAKGRAVDKRSDVWAFGAVLYEMLSGKRAFDAEDVSETLAAVLRAEVNWTLLPNALSPALRTFLVR